MILIYRLPSKLRPFLPCLTGDTINFLHAYSSIYLVPTCNYSCVRYRTAPFSSKTPLLSFLFHSRPLALHRSTGTKVVHVHAYDLRTACIQLHASRPLSCGRLARPS